MAKPVFKDAEGKDIAVDKVIYNNYGEPESLLITNRQGRKEYVHARDYKQAKVDRVKRTRTTTKSTQLAKEQVINKPMVTETTTQVDEVEVVSE